MPSDIPNRRPALLPQFPTVELLCDVMFGGNTYGSDLASLDRYFFHFAMVTRAGQ